MSIRDKDAYRDGAWDWGQYSSALSDGCTISDMDGICERRGRLLFLEGKRPNDIIKKGQKLLHETLRMHGTMIVLFGDPESGEIAFFRVSGPPFGGKWKTFGHRERPLPDGGRPALHDVISQWNNWVDSGAEE